MSQETILVVDDTLENLQLLASMLSDQGYTVRPANNGAMAIEAATLAPPQLILLDINMPEMDGYTVCRHLKADERTADIPVIFISAYGDVSDKVSAFSVGGVDYITKPFQLEEVLARVETHLALRRQWDEIQTLRESERLYLQEIISLKDEVLRMVSHDLKNPLSTITGVLGIVRDSLEEGNALLEVEVPLMERATERMRFLISDLLQLTSIEGTPQLMLEEVSLKHYLHRQAEDYTFTANAKGIKLHVELPTKDAPLHIAARRFDQVMQNLITNAIKYTPPGGDVWLSAELYEDAIWLRVRDNGYGIPEYDLPHIFEKFYRVQRREHLSEIGSGLGMAITKTIVEQHSGQIWVESELGVGSIFTVAVPRPGGAA